ncbi:ABC transporter permease [Propionibacterium freudenreichii]|nr:ABC transporter permease [Propionibacterium freudenreichii]
MNKRQWTLVAGHEMWVKLANKSFIISTLTMVVLMAAGIAFGAWQANKTDTMSVVVTTQQAQQVGERAGALAGAANDHSELSVRHADSDDQARSEVTAGNADAWLHSDGTSWHLTFKDDTKSSLENYVTAAVSTSVVNDLAGRAGEPLDQAHAAMTVSTDVLESSENPGGELVGIVFAMVFMFSSLMFGMQIAQSVTAEKQSRIVEILAAVVPARQLMLGKVAGNTAVALLQMVLYAAIALIGVAVTPLSTMLPSLSGGIGWFLAFFLVGFLTLSCLWAAAGAMAPTTEDLQSTAQPLTWLLMVVYFAGFLAKGNLAVVLSYVPVISSVVMPTRLAMGTAHWWEGLIALLITLAFTVVAIWFGSRIYRRALLQTHGRVSIREAMSHESL